MAKKIIDQIVEPIAETIVEQIAETPTLETQKTSLQDLIKQGLKTYSNGQGCPCNLDFRKNQEDKAELGRMRPLIDIIPDIKVENDSFLFELEGQNYVLAFSALLRHYFYQAWSESRWQPEKMGSFLSLTAAGLVSPSHAIKAKDYIENQAIFSLPNVDSAEKESEKSAIFRITFSSSAPADLKLFFESLPSAGYSLIGKQNEGYIMSAPTIENNFSSIVIGARIIKDKK